MSLTPDESGELKRLRVAHERLKKALLDEGCDCLCDCCWEDEDARHTGACKDLCTPCRLLQILEG